MSRNVRRTILVAVASLLLAPAAFAYCLTGIIWPDGADMRYNGGGKITSGQCISASQMDSAVTGAMSAWRALSYAGTTTKAANKRDGQNTTGWAKLGGGTLGVTNYLSTDRFRTIACGGNVFAEAFEVDVRLTTTYRWTSGGGQCPCAAGSAFYLNAVAEHEFGHVIGLCHTNNPSSLMYPSFGACENKSSGNDENSGENALCY